MTVTMHGAAATRITTNGIEFHRTGYRQGLRSLERSEQFSFSEFPPNSSDVVHVEDGGWEFADSDFGSPIMINCTGHPVTARTRGSGTINVVDPVSASVIRQMSGASTSPRRIASRPRSRFRIRSAAHESHDQIRDPGKLWSDTQRGGTRLALLLAGSTAVRLLRLSCGRVLASGHCQSNACRNVDSILNTNPTLDTRRQRLHPQRTHDPAQPIRRAVFVQVTSDIPIFGMDVSYDVSESRT